MRDDGSVDHTFDGGTYHEVIIDRKTVTFTTALRRIWPRILASVDGFLTIPIGAKAAELR